MKKILFLLLSVFLIGCSETETVDIEGEAVTYEELKNEISESDQELDSVKKELFDTKAELGEVKAEIAGEEERYAGLEELAENRDNITSEVEDTKTELESLQSEINKLEGEILKYEDEPIKLNPGYYYFGIDDIEPGRYKIAAQEGQRGNVFIRDDRGSYVSDTFGKGDDGHTIAEFTFQSSEGDEIEATIPVYLYPVE